ncbi:isopeptide-forming domain-containing fimbrial protein [Bifidobacterium dentium]|uniref:isopeptide-forming domain-containing fimbrial protein n=1 Tax=Bifidobacterium dentium TaxID=1689 RepID=UPI0018B0172B|nr:isopeptide-forming domain-containing fimbrial protein [Bifidobacterium dentium]MBF9691763.1 isopeptide-forming domain-containing fimbrial protein [Bifidobacterium dentium]MBF9697933.1 isopeptide-forming domain-containing fimbrial protein [Bifidobacterium dentium]
MTFRKLLAGVAAAATLLSGMAFGAGSAMADEVESATITLNGEIGAVKGHTYKAVRIGSYDHASFVQKDGVTYVKSLTVNTEAAVATGATTALDAAVAKGTDWNTGDYKNNPVGYVASESGYFTSSPNKPWSGNLRNFVSSLVRQADFKTALVAATAYTAGTDSDTLTISGLEEGLYVVVDTTVSNAENVDHTKTDSIPMLVGTKVSGKDFEGQTLGVVNVKNQTTYIDKVIVKNNREWVGTTERVGDTVTFKLTSQVPLTVGYLNTAEKPYRFSIGDTMSKGLTFQQVTSVTIGNKTLTEADDGATADQYQLTTAANQKYDESDKDSKATSLKFDLSNAVYAAGQNAADSKVDAKAEDTITVVYTAILNEDAVHAVNGANPNKVTLDYTHNPDDNTEHHVPGPEVKVYTYDFGFLKVKADGQTSLDGAKFVIKQGDQYFRFNTTTGLWENGTKDADPVDADKFTGTNGVFQFKGLAEGTYDVVETDAPAGYLSTTKAEFQVVITSTNKDKAGNVLGTEHEIKFVNGNTGFNLLTNLNADGTAAEGGAKVKNLKSITQLPLTGAAGIAIFGVMAALVIGAGLAVGMKRRGIASRLA